MRKLFGLCLLAVLPGLATSESHVGSIWDIARFSSPSESINVWERAVVVVDVKQGCQCGCGCVDCDPSRPCDCGCPCGQSQASIPEEWNRGYDDYGNTYRKVGQIWECINARDGQTYQSDGYSPWVVKVTRMVNAAPEVCSH